VRVQPNRERICCIPSPPSRDGSGLGGVIVSGESFTVVAERLGKLIARRSRLAALAVFIRLAEGTLARGPVVVGWHISPEGEFSLRIGGRRLNRRKAEVARRSEHIGCVF